ncbi:MAG TPA: hypothetical protein VNG35_12485 [Gemmatimonadales bacterium]|nr:hypothetical protein [Gemmatimonadales bacterium]
MSAGEPVSPVQFVSPESIRTLGALLQRSNAVIESEIRGASMGTTLPDHVKVRIACRPAPEYQPGDVVAYWWGDALIAHRVVGRGKLPRARDFYLTRGDGQILCDPAVSAASILGLVSAWFDGSGWRPVATLPSRGLRRWTVIVEQWLMDVHPDLTRRIAAVVSGATRWLRRPNRRT